MCPSPVFNPKHGKEDRENIGSEKGKYFLKPFKIQKVYNFSKSCTILNEGRATT